MSATRTALLYTQFPNGQVNIILNDDEIRRRSIRILNKRGDGLSREIHKGLGFNEKDALPLPSAACEKRIFRLLELPVRPHLASNRIRRLETNRVRRIGVLCARIAKSHNDFHCGHEAIRG